MTLRQRIAGILAVLALAVGALAAFASYVDTSSQLRGNIDDTLLSRAAALVSAPDGGRGRGPDGGRGGEDLRVGDDGCPTPGSFAPATAGQLVSASGQVTACIEGAPVLPFSAADLGVSGSAHRVTDARVDGVNYRVVSRSWPSGGILQVARSSSETEAVLDRLRLRLALFVLIATAVAAALGVLVATWVLGPIMKLRDTAAHIAATSDFATPVDVQASGEVGSLAASFAAMVAAVARSQDQQRRLVADAGHEMRTPLTSLRSNVELIARIEELPPVERREVIADVLADVDELALLLTELVDLASDLAAAEEDEAVSLGDLARAVAARTYRRSGREVVVEESATTAVRARPRQIERVIGNLIDNAIKYSPQRAPIEVEVRGSEVTVLDRGSGVSEENLPRIFDRFYRAVEARTQPGSGLGLSIVDEIVRSHGGSVFARNRPGGGLAVGFRLSGGSPALPGSPPRTS